MSDNTKQADPADPAETAYTGYWRAAHDAGVAPFRWDELPDENQDAWRGSAGDVLAKHGPAGVRAAWIQLRQFRDALDRQASAWVTEADGTDETDAEFGGERAATADTLRRCARQVRNLLPILLEMDAAPPAEPYQATLIPERVERAAPGTAAGGTL